MHGACILLLLKRYQTGGGLLASTAHWEIEELIPVLLAANVNNLDLVHTYVGEEDTQGDAACSAAGGGPVSGGERGAQQACLPVH